MEPDCAVASPSALREGPELLKLPSSLRARRPSRNAPVASPGARANLFGGNLRNTLEENALSTYEEVARFLGPTTTLTRDRSSRSSAYVLSRAGSSLAGSIGGAASFNGERPRLRRSSTRSGASLLPFFGRKDSAVSAAMIHTDSGGLEADARPGTSGLRTTSRLNVGTLDGKTAGFFNHYQVIKTIGSGASGDVKLCMNLYDQTLAAVKLVAKTSRRGSLGSRPPDKAATLKREAEVLTQLCHPNIVNVHEIIDDDSAPHLLCVMDYVEGGPVQLTHQEYTPSADGVFAEQLSEHTAWGYFVQLIDALDYLHSAGVVHGDIKPDNLLLGADGMVRLADFGSAMVLRKDGADTLTAIHGRTPAFLPPEACDGEEFSARSADVWAAGVTLYLMLFGRLPFGHPKLAPFAMYAAVSEGALSFPAEPRVSDACKDLLMAVLAKDAARRATIEDVVSHPWMTEILSDISSRRAVSCEAVGARAIEHWQSGLTTSYSGESSARTEHASLSRQSSSRLRRSASGLCAIHEMQVVREPSRAILRQPSSPVTSSPRAQAVKVVDENAGSGPYSLTASQSVHARMGPGSPLSTRSPQAMGEFKHIVQVLELEFPDVVPKLVLEEGDFLVGEGDASDKMYFIVHGEAEVIKQIASQSEGAEGGGLGDSHGSGCSARVDDENDGTEAARGSDKSSDDFAPMSGRGRVAAVSPTRNGFLPRQPYGKARGLGRYVSGKIDRHVLEEDLVRGSDQSYDSENPSTTHGSGLEAERASWTSRTSQSRASFLRRALGGASRRQDDSFVATQPGLVRRSRSSIDLKTDASRPEGARPDMTSLDRRRLSHWGAAAGGARGLQSATSSSLYNGRGVSFHGAPSRPAPSRFSRETDLGRSESQAGPALGGRAGQPGGESKGSVRGSWVFRSRKAHEDLEHLVRTAAESCDALGRAMRHEGGFRVLARISAGDVVGEIGLLGNSVRTASVRALTRLEVLEVSRSALATIAASAPLLQHDLKRVVAQRTATRRMMEAFEQLAGLHQRFSSEQGGRAAERPKLQAVPSLRALSRVLSRRAVLDEGAADAEEIAGDGSRTVAPAVSMSQMAVIPESREELQARAA
ncbi:unnamed protein product [Pedinophyceae sp. YPF-701]|nr:unnamed protein product [Pedinophyceae sp. YPF-701]